MKKQFKTFEEVKACVGQDVAISDWTSALRLITDPVDGMALLLQQAHEDGRDVQP